jgi:hypothetical protein
MSHNITEVDSFTSTVSVPDGTDDHNQLAEFMQTFVQALANRTHNLNAHGARIDVANTFTQKQTIDVDPSVPLLTTTKTAFDTTPTSTNGWKLELQFPTDGSGRNVSFYVGANDSSGMFALVVNAVWSVVASRWNQENTAKASFAIMSINEELFVSSQPLGTAHWSGWPTNRGDVSIGGALSALSLHSTNDTSVGSAGNFTYAPLRLRTNVIKLANAVGTVLRATDGSIQLSTGTGRVAWPVNVPSGMQWGDIQIMHTQSSTTGDIFGIVQRSAPDWITPALPTYSTPVTATGPSASGLCVTTLSTSGMIFDNASDELEIVWALGNVADTGNKIIAIEMANWQDTGPSNH